MNEEIRDEQWAALYADLLHALAPFGRNDAFGEGDFWLVDDDWGGHQHKVCITSLPFLTRAVTDSIQATLNRYPPVWEVVVAMEFDDPNRPPDGEGLIVRSTEIESHWDTQRVFEDFGEQFRWSAR